MTYTDEKRDKYARWMCYALDARGRERILSNYRNDYGDDECDLLEARFNYQLERWKRLTDVEKKAVIHRENVKAKKELHS